MQRSLLKAPTRAGRQNSSKLRSNILILNWCGFLPAILSSREHALFSTIRVGLFVASMKKTRRSGCPWLPTRSVTFASTTHPIIVQARILILLDQRRWLLSDFSVSKTTAYTSGANCKRTSLRENSFYRAMWPVADISMGRELRQSQKSCNCPKIWYGNNCWTRYFFRPSLLPE